MFTAEDAFEDIVHGPSGFFPGMLSSKLNKIRGVPRFAQSSLDCSGNFCLVPFRQ
jgi:hypothetical protein